MPQTRKKLWRCQQCGSGVRAPGKMRKDNALRYCLDCTAATGKLVERTCVSRETAKQKAREKTQAALERAKEIIKKELKLWPWVLYTEYPKFQNLDAWDDKSKVRGYQLQITRTDATWTSGAKQTLHLRASDKRGLTVRNLLRYMSFLTSSSENEEEIAFCRAVTEITGTNCTDTKQGAMLLDFHYFDQETSKRRSLPKPVRTRKRPQRKTEPKSKLKQLISKREKTTEW